MEIGRLFAIVQGKPDLWLDLTEECFLKGKYPEPEKYIIEWSGKTYQYTPGSPGKINDWIVNTLAVETNHLIDYIKKAMELRRDTYIDQITKKVYEYEQFLDKQLVPRDQEGYYLYGQRR